MNSQQPSSLQDNLQLGFDELSDLVYAESGIVLSKAKAGMIVSRLRNRLSELSLNNLKQYCDFVVSDAGVSEKKEMISALTTNVSGFFREPHHFEVLKTSVFPRILRKLKNSEPVRIWSAGCSTGQEPYSLAIALAEFDSELLSRDLVILASDIDPDVLNVAKRGCYSESQVSGVDNQILKKYFNYNDQSHGKPSEWEISREIQSNIRFRELNLVKDWPIKREFDIIFCRNVVIYFDQKTQSKLWKRFSDVLAPDGEIFVGHSERFVHGGFESIGPTAYRREGAATTINRIHSEEEH